MGKVTKVRLVVPELGMEQELEVSHAERLLGLEKNGGWVLPSDSEYTFENGTINRRGKEESEGRGRKGHDK